MLETTQGVILCVKVKPNSKQFRLEFYGDELVVSCCEVPVKGKVNKELLKTFARLFNRKVELVSGFNTRQKKFLVRSIKAEEVTRNLASISSSR